MRERSDCARAMPSLPDLQDPLIPSELRLPVGQEESMFDRLDRRDRPCDFRDEVVRVVRNGRREAVFAGLRRMRVKAVGMGGEKKLRGDE